MKYQDRKEKKLLAHDNRQFKRLMKKRKAGKKSAPRRSYKKYLLSKEWKAIREKKLQQENYRCQN